MSADSPKKAYRYNCNMIRPQHYSEKSLMESVVDFFSDVVPQAYSGTQKLEDKEKIQWVRFEDSDCNDISKNPDLYKSDAKGLPLLLILGYSNGVQIWHITPNGEAQELMSIRQGPVRTLRVLPSPDTGLGLADGYASKRPLVAMVDSSSAGQPYCSVKFISLKTGDEVHNISFKTLPIHTIECNKRFVVVVFHEKVCLYNACQLQQLFWITSCYPCPGPNVNPVALSTRWLAYADKRLVPLHQSCGGMSGDGAQSYAATVISAAKGAFKGLSLFGEAMVSSVTGNKPGYSNKKPDYGVVDNGFRPGIVSVVDIQNVHQDHFNVNEDNDGEGLIAHFHAHANEPVADMAFDSTGTLLVTACKLGHNFHIFRLMAHPCSSSLGAVHHLYTLHRGDTTAKVIDIHFNSDSRWVTVSTHRGTTHLFPITPYGGPVNVRTHCHPHLVNRASRFHKSAGLEEIEHSSVGRLSPVLSSSPGSSGQYDHYPHLIRQNTLNNNPGNPRLPPYPHPITIYPAYQIKQPLNLTMTPGGKTGSPTHSPTGLDNIFSVSVKFSTPRLCVIGSPKLNIERRDGSKRPVDSVYILAQSGTLVEYVLEPRPRVGGDKVTDDSNLELGVAGRVQWNLQRLKNSLEQRPPLPSNSPLLLAREAVVTQQPTATDLYEPGPMLRQDSKDSLSSDHSGKDDWEEQWLSQVEIVTHAGPHRRLWMGPQFSFKTYQNVQNTTVLSSSSSALLSQSPENTLAAMDITGEDGDLESLKVQPTRSNPVTMPTTRPAYRRLSGSDSSPSPGKGGQLAPLMIEAGSFDQSPHLCDVYSDWAESTVAKQPRGSDDIEEDRIKQTLADAMAESPVKESGPASIRQEITRSSVPEVEVKRTATEDISQRKKEKKRDKQRQERRESEQGEGKTVNVSVKESSSGSRSQTVTNGDSVKGKQPPSPKEREKSTGRECEKKDVGKQHPKKDREEKEMKMSVKKEAPEKKDRKGKKKKEATRNVTPPRTQGGEPVAACSDSSQDTVTESAAKQRSSAKPLKTRETVLTDRTGMKKRISPEVDSKMQETESERGTVVTLAKDVSVTDMDVVDLEADLQQIVGVEEAEQEMEASQYTQAACSALQMGEDTAREVERETDPTDVKRAESPVAVQSISQAACPDVSETNIPEQCKKEAKKSPNSASTEMKMRTQSSDHVDQHVSLTKTALSEETPKVIPHSNKSTLADQKSEPLATVCAAESSNAAEPSRGKKKQKKKSNAKKESSVSPPREEWALTQESVTSICTEKVAVGLPKKSSLSPDRENGNTCTMKDSLVPCGKDGKAETTKAEISSPRRIEVTDKKELSESTDGEKKKTTTKRESSVSLDRGTIDEASAIESTLTIEREDVFEVASKKSKKKNRQALKKESQVVPDNGKSLEQNTSASGSEPKATAASQVNAGESVVPKASDVALDTERSAPEAAEQPALPLPKKVNVWETAKTTSTVWEKDGRPEGSPLKSSPVSLTGEEEDLTTRSESYTEVDVEVLYGEITTETTPALSGWEMDETAASDYSALIVGTEKEIGIPSKNISVSSINNQDKYERAEKDVSSSSLCKERKDEIASEKKPEISVEEEKPDTELGGVETAGFPKQAGKHESDISPELEMSKYDTTEKISFSSETAIGTSTKTGSSSIDVDSLTDVASKIASAMTLDTEDGTTDVATEQESASSLDTGEKADTSSQGASSVSADTEEKAGAEEGLSKSSKNKKKKKRKKRGCEES